jgi:hypothetical protein
MSLLKIAQLIARGAISNRKLIAKYGKSAFEEAKKYLKTPSGKEVKETVSSKSKDKYVKSPEKKVTAKITKKTEEFLKGRRSDDAADAINYSVRKGKLTMKNNKNLVKEFKEAYSGARQSDFPYEKKTLPKSLTTDKLNFKPGLKDGGLVVRGQGAAIRGKKFKGIF